MKILDLLAKLGILRIGARKATYTTGADRPAEFMSDDVVNAGRDLAAKADTREITGAGKAKLEKGSAKK